MFFRAAIVAELALLAPATLAQVSPLQPERWILVGDSIQANIFEQTIEPQARNLIANQIPLRANVIIHNVSAPGMRMTARKLPEFTLPGASGRLSTLEQISGAYGAAGVVITLGSNDWAQPDVEKAQLIEAYRVYVAHARKLGLEVVCVGPIWRSDWDHAVRHPDGDYVLADFSAAIRDACVSAEGSYIDGLEAPLANLRYYGDVNPPIVHLNTKGHAVFADWLVAEMRKIGYWKR